MTQNEALKPLGNENQLLLVDSQIINITLLLIIQTQNKSMKYKYYLTVLVLLSLFFFSICQQEVAQNEQPQPQTQSNQIQENDLPKSQNDNPTQNIDNREKEEDTENKQDPQIDKVEEIKQQQKKDQQYQQIYFPQAIQLIDQTQNNNDLVNQNQEDNQDIGDSYITFTENQETDVSQPTQDQFIQFNAQNFKPIPKSFRRQPSRTAPLSEMRDYFVYLTNKLRNKYDASNLTFSPFLSKIAQGHSQDMVRRDFFDHTNPDGQSVGDRANRYNYFGRIGENLALAYSLDQCQNGFIKSPGHFKNAINKIWDEIGVGIAFNRRNAYLVTVLFTPRDISRSKLDGNQISYYQRQLSQMLLSQNPNIRRQDKKLSQLIKTWMEGNRRTKIFDFVMKKGGFMKSMMVLMFETDFSRDFVKQIQKNRNFVLKNRGFTGFGLGLKQKQNRMEIYVMYY